MSHILTVHAPLFFPAILCFPCPRALTKYRPPQAVVVVTTKQHVANQCNINWGTVPLLLPPSAHRSIEQVCGRLCHTRIPQAGGAVTNLEPAAFTSLAANLHSICLAVLRDSRHLE